MLQVVNPKYEQQYRETASKYLVPKDASLKQEIKQSLTEDRVHHAKSFWYNPCTSWKDVEKDPVTGNRPKPNSIYFGENESRSRPTWNSFCLDYGAYSSYLKSADASTDRKATRLDNIQGCFGQEIESDAYSFLRSLEADVMTSGDFPNMQLLSTFVDILNVQQRDFSLLNAVSTKMTNTLNIMTAAYSRYQITDSVGELEASESRKGKWDTQTFKMSKASGHIAWSDEFLLQNWIIDPMSYASQNLASDVVRVKASKISQALTGLTTATTATGDFSAFKVSNGTETDHADKNPILIFSGMRNEIYANYARPDTVASNDRTYNFYLVNPYITPLQQQPISPADTAAGVVPSPGLVNTKWYVDASLPDNWIYYYNRAAVLFVQSVSRSSSYRDEIPGANGTLYRDWHGCFTYMPGFGRKMTGISP